MNRGFGSEGRNIFGYENDGCHGGLGGTSPADKAYDSIVSPQHIGGGGWSFRGGGAIVLDVAGDVIHDGIMNVSGQSGYAYHAGAGGTINLRAKSISGSGHFFADASYICGLGMQGGGGGRIALVIDEYGKDFGNYTGTITAYGHSQGGAGTIYTETGWNLPGRGEVLLDNRPMAAGRTAVPPRAYNAELYPNPTYQDGEVNFATFRVRNKAILLLYEDFVLGDIFLETADSVLDLNFNKLYVLTEEHPLGPGTVRNPGEIIWRKSPRGTYILFN